MTRSIFSLLIALVVLSFSHPTAFHYFASIKGSKQGLLKAASNSKGGRESKGWVEIFSFSFGASIPVTTPGSRGGGGRAGKVSLSSIVITKKTDAFSPLLSKMFESGEIIDSLVVQSVDDQQRVAKTTVVRNGRIKEIKRNGNNEIISLSFERMEEK
jgi:type VI protein secretion system component Hcp